MIAIQLLLLAGLISAAATQILPNARWVYRAPGLGLAAWYAVLASVTVSGLVAAASLVARWPATQKTVCSWWAFCVDVLSGDLGPIGHAIVWTSIAGLAAGAGFAVRRLATVARDAARLLREHHNTLTLIGRLDPRLGAVVVDDPVPAAYALPGRRHRIVITSGAIADLPAPQVAAILAHERAHTRHHHHLLLAAARMLTKAFPAMAVFADAHRQIDRLVELHADDIATRAHAPLDLARALVACAEAATRSQCAPVPAMAAAAHGGDALERVHRLLTPPPPVSPRRRLAITASLIALTATPIAVAALGLAIPALGACMPVTS
ncbi:M48 family metalloprotease [Micromonospora sp. NPDC005806]|uniref:M48 family metalloprotease n=1 Tax=Micromonospora sp. NPDC005806 TaxID=3364234 RepID=UPI0036A7593C